MVNLLKMLQINNLTKSFLQRGIVLNKLNLNVNEGDSVSISGPSGSGKTTLLNIIGLLDKPDSGEIFFKGTEILNYTTEESALYRNRNIGFIFQEHLLLPYLNVRENILMPLIASKLADSEYKEKVSAAEKLMERTGIAVLAEKYPFRISGGEAQRVALVRALVNKPSLLLADEPTGSLDKKNAENLGNILIEMNRDFGITVILATHSASLAGRMAKRLKLNEGALYPDQD
jgi:ABC-type lipoprotein export system ATPase subunit